MKLNHQACVAHLEAIRWQDQPICPYCMSRNSTPIERATRYHCNDCFTSYSVTVGTLFHKTHVDLQKWFQAISLVLKSPEAISVRKLAREISINKNTAAYMLQRIRQARHEEEDLLQAILAIMKSEENG